MHVPQFWARGSAAYESRDGNKGSFECWRWSDHSVEDARRQAELAAQALAQRWHTQSAWPPTSASHYYLEGRPPREEVLERGCAGLSAEQAVITRNSWGVRVLNTANAMFIDIDLPQPRLSWWKSLFPGARKAAVANAAAAIEQRVAEWATPYRARLWRTAAGYRVLRLDRTVDSQAAETTAAFSALGADPLYATLCKQQSSFRARLDPKPWRVGIGSPPTRLPVRETAEQEMAHRDWLQRFTLASNPYACCRFIADFGSAPANPQLLVLADWHDHHTAARSEKPLA